LSDGSDLALFKRFSAGRPFGGAPIDAVLAANVDAVYAQIRGPVIGSLSGERPRQPWNVRLDLGIGRGNLRSRRAPHHVATGWLLVRVLSEDSHA